MNRNTNVTRTYEEVFSWMLEQHRTNMTLKEISKKYNTDAGYQFKKFGIKSIEVRIKRRNNKTIIKDFMQDIDTPEKSYILGLIFADGSVSKNTVKITLHKNDIDILLKIREYLIPNIKLHTDKNNVSLIISSKEMVNNLHNFGITNTKTYDDFSIPDLFNFGLGSKSLYRHFIRGYFDGDGTIFQDGKYLKFNICSITPKILEDIQKIFTENNIKSYINVEKRQGKIYKLPQGNSSTNCKDMYRLFVAKKESLIKLYNFLYSSNTDFYISRKKQTFDKICQH
jgi:hypothetical protein